MANQTFEEAIRLAFETSGTDGIKQAATIIANMGDVSEEAKQQAAGLLDQIGNVEKSNVAVRQYGELGKSVLEYQRNITTARAKVVELADAIKASDAPTKAQTRELDKARTGLKTLVAEQQKQLGTLRTLKTSLDAQGISTRSAAASQRDLAARTATASTNLRTMVTDLKRTRDADAALQASLAAAAQKSKAETDQYDAALKKVRSQIDANKAAARTGSAETVAGLETVGGGVGRLRTALAGLTAYFSFQTIIGGVKSLLGVGDQFDKFQKQLTNMYGSAAEGAKSFAWVKQFAKDTPLTLDQVMQSFIQLKNFGIDPMAGAMQSAVDQNAKLGGESERLQRITLAMGQAFAKGKLQGQDIKQMIEAGVPVWQLLSEVTGKNVQQLQKMSEAGALGKDVMQAFFAQMGKDASGAAIEQMATLSGQWSNFKDNLEQWADRSAKEGVLKYFIDQLGAVNKLFGQMAQDGRLDAYAKRVSDSIIGMAQVVQGATKFVWDHAAAIKNLGKVYLGLKLGSVIGNLGLLASRMASAVLATRAVGAAVGTTTVTMGLLRGAVALLFTPLGGVAALLGGVAIAANYAADGIVEYASKHNEASRVLNAQEEKNKALFTSLSEMYGKRAAALAEYANVQVLAADKVATLTAAQRDAYQKNLAGHAAYLAARRDEARLMVASGEASESWVAHLKEVGEAEQKTADGAKAYSEGVRVAAEAAAHGMSVAAVRIRESLSQAADSAADAKTKIAAEFEDLGKKSPEQIGDLAVAIASMANEAGHAGEVVRNNLHDALSQVTGEDLLTLQTQGALAFVKFGVSAKDAAGVVDTTLQVALERLGVSAEQWGLKTTSAGQENIRVFQVVAGNASATAATIEAAFSKALANATTADDAKAIGDAMAAAGEKGAVGFDSTARSVLAVQDRVRALQAAVDPLADSFATLGIQSQRALDAVAAKAKNAFENIVRGSRDGTASMNDVRAAFDGYAKAQLASVEHSEEWRKIQVKASLEVQASIFGVSDGLAKMGLEGIGAGESTAKGMAVAQSSLKDTKAATDDATTSMKNLGAASSDAAERSGAGWVVHARTVASLGGLAKAFTDDLAKLNVVAGAPHLWATRWNETFAEWRRQGAEMDSQLANIAKQNAAYDEMGKRVEALRTTYRYLNDDQLRALAQAQQTLEENQKRAEADAKQKREAADAATRAAVAGTNAQTEQWDKELGIDANGTKKTGGAGAAGTKRIAIDLNVSASQTAGAVPAQMSPTDVQKVANEVVRQIGIARSSSNH